MKAKYKKHIATGVFLFFCAFILALSLRGIPGNPTEETINNSEWKEEGPLELSPDRGRFVLAYSLIENNSFQFSLPLAKFTTPDVGYINGKYVSLFNPGLSFLIIPGYVAGKYFGTSQLGTFAVVAFFALLNVALIRAIATRLGAGFLSANLGALAFIFATPAFAYAVSLYQHHISVFLLLLAIYSVIRWNNLWSVGLVLFLTASSIVIDNPNLFFMVPVVIYALGKIILVQNEQDKINVNFKLAGLLTLLAVILPAVFFMWFNKESYGNPMQLPGTIKGVQEIDESGNPINSKILQDSEMLKSESNSEISNKGEILKPKKTAVGFFKTRNLLNGFYIHIISPDRGILRFAPIVLFGIFGIFHLYKRNYKIANLLVAVIGANLLLYSMWGDPWGGWAFGSRYLIPVYALLGIGIALAAHKFRRNYLFISFFVLIMGYSVWVNSLGAITSNKNPTQPEILALETLTGREEKYTFMRNWQELKSNKLKSFIFQTEAKNYMSAENYHRTIYFSVTAVVLLMIIISDFGEDFKKWGSFSFAFIGRNIKDIRSVGKKFKL